VSIERAGRRALLKALALGSLSGSASAQALFGDRPSKMPAGRSIYRLSGKVTVNDVEATLDTVIKCGDTVRGTKGCEIVFVVGAHAMILRGESTIVIAPPDPPSQSFVVRALNVIQGALLTVCPPSRLAVTTPTAHVGVRGTGFYIEASPEETYFCTCYGVTDVASVAAPEMKETITARHHDRPVYVRRDAAPGRNIRNAPFFNHTDEELTLIEALVGRTPPFVFGKDSYGGPRREY